MHPVDQMLGEIGHNPLSPDDVALLTRGADPVSLIKPGWVKVLTLKFDVDVKQYPGAPPSKDKVIWESELILQIALIRSLRRGSYNWEIDLGPSGKPEENFSRTRLVYAGLTNFSVDARFHAAARLCPAMSEERLMDILAG